MKYSQHKIIAHSAKGMVFSSKHKNGSKVVVKERWQAERLGNPLTKEQDLISRLDHPNIIKVIDSYRHGGALSIVFPASEGDLSNDIEKRRDLNKDVINNDAWYGRRFSRIHRPHLSDSSFSSPSFSSKNSSSTFHHSELSIWIFLNEMIDVLDFIHSKDVIHRDLKPSNILLFKRKAPLSNLKNIIQLPAPSTPIPGDPSISQYPDLFVNYMPVLCDFGIATEGSTAKTMIGTPRYMSPEVCRGEVYSAAADVWGLGLCVLELCELRPPFPSHLSMRELMGRIADGDIRVRMNKSRWSPELCSIVDSMISIDSKHRIEVKNLKPLIGQGLKNEIRRRLDNQQGTMLPKPPLSKSKQPLDKVELPIKEKSRAEIITRHDDERSSSLQNIESLSHPPFPSLNNQRDIITPELASFEESTNPPRESLSPQSQVKDPDIPRRDKEGREGLSTQYQKKVYVSTPSFFQQRRSIREKRRREEAVISEQPSSQLSSQTPGQKIPSSTSKHEHIGVIGLLRGEGPSTQRLYNIRGQTSNRHSSPSRYSIDIGEPEIPVRCGKVLVVRDTTVARRNPLTSHESGATGSIDTQIGALRPDISPRALIQYKKEEEEKEKKREGRRRRRRRRNVGHIGIIKALPSSPSSALSIPDQHTTCEDEKRGHMDSHRKEKDSCSSPQQQVSLGQSFGLHHHHHHNCEDSSATAPHFTPAQLHAQAIERRRHRGVPPSLLVGAKVQRARRQAFYDIQERRKKHEEKDEVVRKPKHRVEYYGEAKKDVHYRKTKIGISVKYYKMPLIDSKEPPTTSSVSESSPAMDEEREDTKSKESPFKDSISCVLPPSIELESDSAKSSVLDSTVENARNERREDETSKESEESSFISSGSRRLPTIDTDTIEAQPISLELPSYTIPIPRNSTLIFAEFEYIKLGHVNPAKRHFPKPSTAKGAYILFEKDYLPSHQLIVKFTSSSRKETTKKYKFPESEEPQWFYLPINLPDIARFEMVVEDHSHKEFEVKSLAFVREEIPKESIDRKPREIHLKNLWSKATSVTPEFMNEGSRYSIPIPRDDPTIIDPAFKMVNGSDYLYIKELSKYNKSLDAQDMLKGEAEVTLSHLSIPFPSPSPVKGAYICVDKNYSSPSLLFTFTDCDGTKTSKKYEFSEPKHYYEWHYLHIDLLNVIKCEIEGKGMWIDENNRVFNIKSLVFIQERLIRKTHESYRETLSFMPPIDSESDSTTSSVSEGSPVIDKSRRNEKSEELPFTRSSSTDVGIYTDTIKAQPISSEVDMADIDIIPIPRDDPTLIFAEFEEIELEYAKPMEFHFPKPSSTKGAYIYFWHHLPSQLFIKFTSLGKIILKKYTFPRYRRDKWFYLPIDLPDIARFEVIVEDSKKKKVEIKSLAFVRKETTEESTFRKSREIHLKNLWSKATAVTPKFMNEGAIPRDDPTIIDPAYEMVNGSDYSYSKEFHEYDKSSRAQRMLKGEVRVTLSHLSIPFPVPSPMKGAYIHVDKNYCSPSLLFTFTLSDGKKIPKKYEFSEHKHDYEWHFLHIDLSNVVLCEIQGKGMWREKNSRVFNIKSLFFFREETSEERLVRQTNEHCWIEAPIFKPEFMNPGKVRFIPIPRDDPDIINPSFELIKGKNDSNRKESRYYDQSSKAQEMLKGDYSFVNFSHLSIPFPSPSPMKGAYICVHKENSSPSLLFTFTLSNGEGGYRSPPIHRDDPLVINPSFELVKGKNDSMSKESKEYDMSSYAQETLSHLSIPFLSPSPMKGANICVHKNNSSPSLLFTFTCSNGEKISKKYEFTKLKHWHEWHFLPIDLPNVILCEIQGKGTWKEKNSRCFQIESLIFITGDDIPPLPSDSSKLVKHDSFTLTSSATITPQCIIGQGGFGEVILVKVEGIPIPCVLKKMLKIADKKVVKTCRKEFRVQRKLFNNPKCFNRISRPLYILDLLDADLKGVYGFLMEFCIGGSVSSFAKKWCIQDGKEEEEETSKSSSDSEEREEKEEEVVYCLP
ncbi:hypothetical protein ADUPG1_013605 [Aduncisulcus paluster]|uniref:Protein kinase domain-containing protein n=1 Tax=Aduncisulcus paluster TaxID=2918883 RepID=A0ABQ5K3I9_9EUKA|nr:hypothetical protein ADUPG1_013605 [Aduncisulcus paluster]